MSISHNWHQRIVLTCLIALFFSENLKWGARINLASSSSHEEVELSNSSEVPAAAKPMSSTTGKDLTLPSLPHEFRDKLPIKNQMDEAILGCTRCPEKLSNHYALRVHIEKMHAKDNVCNICRLLFSTVEKLDEHMRNHRRKSFDRDLRCPVCGETFINDHYLRAHQENWHPVNISSTSAPLTSTSSPPAEDSVVQNVSTPGTRIANEPIEEGSNLSAGPSSKSPDNSLQCLLCKEKFAGLKAVRNHLCKVLKYKCDAEGCTRKFHEESAL